MDIARLGGVNGDMPWCSGKIENRSIPVGWTNLTPIIEESIGDFSIDGTLIVLPRTGIYSIYFGQCFLPILPQAPPHPSMHDNLRRINVIRDGEHSAIADMPFTQGSVRVNGYEATFRNAAKVEFIIASTIAFAAFNQEAPFVIVQIG